MLRIGEILNEKNITVAELSKKTGINVSALYRYIQGESTPNFFTAYKIAKTLKVNMEDLIMKEDVIYD